MESDVEYASVGSINRWDSTYMTIITSGCKQLPIFRKLYRRDGTSMAGECEYLSAFEQIDDFGNTIVTARYEIVAGRMEIERIHRPIVYAVVLDQFPYVYVEDLHSAVVQSDRHQGTVRMPGHLTACPLLIVEAVHTLPGRRIKWTHLPGQLRR